MTRHLVVRRSRARLGGIVLVLLGLPDPLAAQAADSTRPEPIRDNSFLVEEAYNQERGVVQHISTFARSRDRSWGYTFTQEWPLGGERHQLSGTIALLGDRAGSGMGDAALNYRLQLVGGSDAALAVSPRLSLLLPSGDADAGRGRGAPGVQVNLPVSWQPAEALALHGNVGGSVTPRAKVADGTRARSSDLLLGGSAIWLARPRFNVMLEATHLVAREPVPAGVTRSTTTFVSPGVRWAYDFASGLQVVPGLAMPIEVGRGDADRSLFLYLSFEHPFTAAARREARAPRSAAGTVADSQVDARITRLADLVAAYHRAGRFDGAVLVAERGHVLYEGAVGDANREWHVPNTPDTRFRIASTTKQFTAALVLRLAEEGMLRLDAPVTTYLPDYPRPQGEQVTLHHLLSHSSGIPNYVAVPGFYDGIGRTPRTPTQVVALFDSLPLHFTPGARWEYSNSNYVLLGAIVERVTSLAWRDALHRWVLDPLGLRDTDDEDEASIVARRAEGYLRADSATIRAPFVDPSMIYAAGNLRSTVRDLYAWHRALHEGRVFRADSSARMFSGHVETETGLGRYGYGVFVGTQTLGGRAVRVIQHGGTIPGFVAGFWRMPDDDRVVIALDNGMHQATSAMVRDLAEILYGGTPTAPTAR